MPPAAAITAEYQAGHVSNVLMHDGSWVRLRKVADDYDPSDRDRAYSYIRERQKAGEIVTGLLYISPDSNDMHEHSNTIATPLVQLPFEAALPGQRRTGEAAEEVQIVTSRNAIPSPAFNHGGHD